MFSRIEGEHTCEAVRRKHAENNCLTRNFDNMKGMSGVVQEKDQRANYLYKWGVPTFHGTCVLSTYYEFLLSSVF